MKIKRDFVTNSSSTNFTFVFKGGKKENLFEEIKKNSKLFTLKFENNQCGPDEIAEDVAKILRKRKFPKKIETLQLLISKEERIYRGTEKDIKRLLKNKRKDSRMWGKTLQKWNRDEAFLIKFLKELEEKGFDSSFTMAWGNQPGMGDIQGGNTGECMFGKGPKKVVRKNLAVYNPWGFISKENDE